MKLFNLIKANGIRLACMACAFGLGAASAQEFPAKPIKIWVGAPAGSTPDLLARLIAQDLSDRWKQPVIVDNKAGASGLIASQELVKAPADGHVLMINVNGIVAEAPHIVRVPFDYFKEVRPLVELGRSSLLLVGSPRLPANDFQSLVSYIRAHPGQVSYASYSPGTISHIAGLEMNQLMGLDMVHVGYRGAPPALPDVMSGSVPLMFAGLSTVLSMVKNNQLKAFATSSPSRLSQLPDVPTFAELGYKSMTRSIWHGLWVKPSMPPAIQSKIRDTVLSVLQTPRVKRQLSTIGIEPGTGAAPDELIASLRADSDRHGAALKAIHFKLE